jgi:Dimerisation domain
MKAEMKRIANETEVTPDRIFQLSFGYAPPLIIETAVRHGIFDALSDGSKNLDEVSAKTGASLRGLRAVMNALTALDFLAKDQHGRYSLTPESEKFLVTGKPTFMGGFFRHISAHFLPN